jgi:hypothetical protein
MSPPSPAATRRGRVATSPEEVFLALGLLGGGLLGVEAREAGQALGVGQQGAQALALGGVDPALGQGFEGGEVVGAGGLALGGGFEGVEAVEEDRDGDDGGGASGGSEAALEDEIVLGGVLAAQGALGDAEVGLVPLVEL